MHISQIFKHNLPKLKERNHLHKPVCIKEIESVINNFENFLVIQWLGLGALVTRSLG